MSADHWHYAHDIHGAAEQHHRHYDEENLIAGLREDLGRAEARIADLEDRLEAALDRWAATAASVQLLEDRAGDEDQDDESGDESWRNTLADYAVASGAAEYVDEDQDDEDGDPHYARSRRAIRMGEVDDDFAQDRHADLDAGENGGALTDTNFYDRTDEDEALPHCGVEWPNLGPAGGMWTCTLDAGHEDDHEAQVHGGKRAASLSAVIPQGHPDITVPEAASGGTLERMADYVAETADLIEAQASEAAPCGCPKADGVIRHRRSSCTDPVVARLDWYADDAAGGES